MLRENGAGSPPCLGHRWVINRVRCGRRDHHPQRLYQLAHLEASGGHLRLGLLGAVCVPLATLRVTVVLGNPFRSLLKPIRLPTIHVTQC